MKPPTSAADLGLRFVDRLVCPNHKTVARACCPDGPWGAGRSGRANQNLGVDVRRARCPTNTDHCVDRAAVRMESRRLP